MGTLTGKSPSSTIWSRYALAKNGVLGNPVNRGRMILRQAPRMTAPIDPIFRERISQAKNCRFSFESRQR